MSTALKTNLKSVAGLKRRLSVTVPPERFEDEIDKRLRDTARRVRIKGFRPGRAPLHIVREHYQSSLRHQVLDDHLNEILDEAIRKHKLKVAGRPILNELNDSRAGGFDLTVSLEVYPEFKKYSYRGLKLTRLTAEVAAEDVAQLLEQIRQRNSHWDEVERQAQKGDQVVYGIEVHYAGKCRLKRRNATTLLGEVPLDLGLGDHLEGQSPGSEFSYEHTLATEAKEINDKKLRALAGQTITVSGSIVSVKESKLPELTDDFYQQLGLEGGREELDRRLREQLEERIQSVSRNNLLEQIVDYLVEKHKKTELPEQLIMMQISRELKNLKQSLGIPEDQELPESLGIPQDALYDRAKGQVRVGLIMNHLVESKKLSASNEEITRAIEQEAEKSNRGEQWIKWCQGNDDAQAHFENRVIEEKILNHFLDIAKIADKAVSCKELFDSDSKQKMSD